MLKSTYESGNGKAFGSHAMAMMFEVGYDIFSPDSEVA